MIDHLRSFPALTKLMDEGVQKEIDREIADWNARKNQERFPLSPSQIGKCGLALARNLSHYLGLADYPRTTDSLSPRTKRIFARGDLLEDALIGDFGRNTALKPTSLQRRVRLYPLSKDHAVGGNIDSILVMEVDNNIGGQPPVRILTDYKSKGARYSANFSDTISEFFSELRQTGLVEVLHSVKGWDGKENPTSFLITDAWALFNLISLDEFFVDYLHQLNGYALSEEILKEGGVDFVSLYYENKNTCANYEVRWKPSKELFDHGRAKMQYVYDTTLTKGAEAVAKEFQLGSARCKLCEYNERCWGKYTPGASSKITGSLNEGLDRALRAAQREHHVVTRVEEEVLRQMANEGLTHIQTSDGLTYERKFLKSPKPHYELRLSK